MTDVYFIFFCEKGHTANLNYYKDNLWNLIHLIPIKKYTNVRISLLKLVSFQKINKYIYELRKTRNVLINLQK